MDGLEIEEQDVTLKFENWFDSILDLEHNMELQYKKQQLQPNFRFCDDIYDYLDLIRNQRGLGLEAFSSFTQLTTQIDSREILVYMIKELLPFLSAFAVKKTEPLGRGVVWLQSELPINEWLNMDHNQGNANNSNAPFNMFSRQFVITYSSQKVLKRSNHRLFDVLDKEEILKDVGDYNQKTHLLFLISLPDFQHIVQLPLSPNFEHCKRAAFLSKVDSMVINLDVFHRKIIVCEILESSIPLATRKRN